MHGSMSNANKTTCDLKRKLGPLMSLPELHDPLLYGTWKKGDMLLHLTVTPPVFPQEDEHE